MKRKHFNDVRLFSHVFAQFIMYSFSCIELLRSFAARENTTKSCQKSEIGVKYCIERVINDAISKRAITLARNVP